ncbi:hypothetical protein [Gabonibacter chumensis]|uniref:hypothetical protein n=1 Tax=Gabonibacter chumensis TaxID=2972474 RepID=UPI0025732443|nr:hypothetical protein [Gabonibacter chumensis]MCR9011074.1 hypothetical protein [Gabonibacter chumensis]
MKRIIYFCFISILFCGCVHELEETNEVESIYYNGDNKSGISFVKRIDEQNQKKELERILEFKRVRLMLDHTCFGLGFREGLHFLIPIQDRMSGVINGCLIYKIENDESESIEQVKPPGELYLIDQKEYNTLPYEVQVMRSVFFKNGRTEV